MTERMVRLDLATEEAEQALQRFLGRLPQFGGSVLEIQPAYPVVKSQAEIDRESAEATTLPSNRLMLPHFYIFGESFTSRAHLTHIWTVLSRLVPLQTEENLTKHENERVIDLDTLKEEMRKLETGREPESRLLSPKRWDLLAAIINSRMGDPEFPALILPWDQAIHKDLQNPYEEVRQKAAQTLQKTYDDAQQLQLFRN
jgi:hypothetical protein